MPKSDPTSPAGTSKMEQNPLPPLDFHKHLSGSQRQKLFSSSTPPHTPTTLSVDTAVDAIHKQKINRTSSSGSAKKRLSGSSVEEGAIPVTVSPLAGGASAVISPSGVTATCTTGTIMSSYHPPASPKTSGNPFQPPKSKFKMAHESFRQRILFEQYGFEPVFMTKKRTADSKFSEFKGGDLNKYTSRSYTIKNGNEIFGGGSFAMLFLGAIKPEAK
ncbi:hypothetical protein FO519_000874 [Halicephalobus sp. NKZ332]|nr:hypothetical protein FO519_000874 [Halicephalobus sp. NKZ332]